MNNKTKMNIELWTILVICVIGNHLIAPVVCTEFQYPFNNITFFGLEFMVWFIMIKSLIKYKKIE